MTYQYKLFDDYKSEGEKKIGAYLEKRNIDFTYERPIAVLDNGKTKIWHPDFYLDNYHILIEYFGMNADPFNKKVNEYKKKIYRKNRFALIDIYPSDLKTLWQKKIDQGIQNTLEGRISDYASKSDYGSHLQRPRQPYSQMRFRFYS